MSAHARLSASAAKRWIACPGSVALNQGPRKSSVDADTGTYAHEIAAHCLADDSASPSDFLAQEKVVDGHKVVCDLDMIDSVRVYVDEVNADHQDGDEGWIEMSLDDVLAKEDPDLGGTADYVRYRPTAKHLRVFDYKNGAGMFVDADDNTQMKIYAVGALLETARPVTDVTVTIVQPRYEGAKPVRDYTFKAVELIDFLADLKEAANATRVPNPAYSAGDHCTFCAGRPTCPELERHQHALTAAEFADVPALSPERLGQALLAIPAVKARIKALEEAAYDMAVRGTEIPGFKLVDKRPTRKWKSDGDVIEWAQAQAIDPWAPRELLSPAQLEKKIAADAPRGKKKDAGKVLEPFVEKVSSGTALVPIADDRPPAKVVSAEDFAGVA